MGSLRSHFFRGAFIASSPLHPVSSPQIGTTSRIRLFIVCVCQLSLFQLFHNHFSHHTHAHSSSSSHVASAGIIQNAAAVLWKLSLADHNRLEIGECGGVAVLLKVCLAYMHDDSIVTRVISALHQLVTPLSLLSCPSSLLSIISCV